MASLPPDDRSRAQRPVLAAVKLHSARESDLRDVVAIAEVIDLKTVIPHLYRGDEDVFRERLQCGLDIHYTEDLKHGYRSDFGASAVSSETIMGLKAYLSVQLERLSQ